MKKKHIAISWLALGLVLGFTAIYKNQMTGEVSSALITISIFCFVGVSFILLSNKKSSDK